MEKKSYGISVRVTKDIYEKFNKLAKFRGKNKSDYLNNLIKCEYYKLKDLIKIEEEK